MSPDRVAVVGGAQYAAAGNDIAGWRPGILRRHAGTAELINSCHSLKPSGAHWNCRIPVTSFAGPILVWRFLFVEGGYPNCYERGCKLSFRAVARCIRTRDGFSSGHRRARLRNDLSSIYRRLSITLFEGRGERADPSCGAGRRRRDDHPGSDAPRAVRPLPADVLAAGRG